MSITIGTVTITRNPSYGKSWWNSRPGQDKIITADGGHVVYDSGFNELKGVIVLNNVSKAEGDSLRTYITGTAVYEQNSFTITPPANTDIGGGVGTALTSCYFDGGSDLDGVFEFVAPGSYNIQFPYWKKVT